jgi:hypothetical protein
VRKPVKKGIAFSDTVKVAMQEAEGRNTFSPRVEPDDFILTTDVISF